MNEMFRPDQPETQETVERKKERLGPVFERSRSVFENPDRPLREGALTVVQRLGDGRETSIPGLVALTIDDHGVELGPIEEDGEIGPSGFMKWESIVDAKEAGSS